MPEWWGLRVQGLLVRVIRWGAGSIPTLADFDVEIAGGSEYEITPLPLGAGAVSCAPTG